MGGWSDGVDMFSVCWLSTHQVHLSFIQGEGKWLQDKPKTCYPEETQECSSHLGLQALLSINTRDVDTIIHLIDSLFVYAKNT